MGLEFVDLEVNCRHCGGTGKERYSPGWECGWCNGTGKMKVVRLVSAQPLNEADLLPARCPECGGEVGKHRALCPLA